MYKSATVDDQAFDHRRPVLRARRGGADSDRGDGARTPKARCCGRRRSNGCGCSARRKRRSISRRSVKRGNIRKRFTNPGTCCVATGGRPLKAGGLHGVDSMAPGSQRRAPETMPPPESPPAEPGRRRALALLVNSTVAVIGGALSALLGVFAVRPARGAARKRWIRAGTLGELTANVPVPRVLAVPRRRRLVSGPIPRDGLPRLERRARGQGVLGHVHASRLSGAVGRSGQEIQMPLPRRGLRRHGRSARRPAAAAARPSSRRGSTRLTTACWCACDARASG